MCRESAKRRREPAAGATASAKTRPQRLVPRGRHPLRRRHDDICGVHQARALTIQHALVKRTSGPCTQGSKAARTFSMTCMRQSIIRVLEDAADGTESG